MKKIFSLLLILILILSLFSLTACKKTEVNDNISKSQTETLKPDGYDDATTSINGTNSENTTTNPETSDSDGEATEPSISTPPSTDKNTSNNNSPSKDNVTSNTQNQQTTSSDTTKPNNTTKPNSKPTTSETKPSDNSNTQTPSDKTNQSENKTDNNTNNSETTKPTEKPEEKPSKPEVVSPSNQMILVIKNEFIRLVNEERVKFGFQALNSNAVLNQASDVRAKECFDVFSHTRPNGSTFNSLFDDGEFEYDYCELAENLTMTTNFGDNYITEENIFTGTETQLKEIAQILFNNFKNSKPHYTTMLSSDFKDIGVGISTSTDKKTNILYICCCNLFGAT